ncbi:MAG: 2Fe-2S iron-sulfur cluster binding domain-containing protein [Alphaproteobacteria bacterium]|nr:MAG: 2Fe-2S iron-sulfur cluster binding domain-containing protein [Alphaproteobacteria bacterium]
MALPGWNVTLQPSGRRFEAIDGLSVLESAEYAGIALDSSCRNGTCRTCILQSTQGSVRHAVEWPGLSADEKRGGWILPCVAHAISDLVLVAPATR